MKLFNTIGYITITLAFMWMGLLGYWLFYPYDVITIHKSPMTLKTEYKAGEDLQWYVNVTHHTKGVKVEVVRQLQNDFYVNLPQAGYITNGEKQEFINSIVLPDFLPAGKYTLSLTSIFKVNPIREIIISTTTNEFTIK